MNDSNNLTPVKISQPVKSDALAHPLRAWHIMYTILGVLIVALFVVGGLQLALYEMSPARGSTAGLAVAIFLLYGVIACVALGSAALFTLPFYIMARKRVAQNIAKAPEKKVRIGVIAAVIVFGLVVALVALIVSSFLGI